MDLDIHRVRRPVRPPLIWMAFWFLTGRHPFGHPRGNYTFLHPAKEITHRSGRAHWTALDAAYRRMLRRWSAIFFLVPFLIVFWRPIVSICWKIGQAIWWLLTKWWWCVVLAWHHPLPFILGAPPTFTMGWVIAWRFSREKREYRRTLAHVHEGAISKGGLPAHLRPADWLHVPRNYLDDPTCKIVAELPTSYDAAEKERENFGLLVAHRLGGHEWEQAWTFPTGEPTLTLTPARKPPASVEIDLLGPLLAETSADELLLGIGCKDHAVRHNLLADSPHLLISIPPGLGKTTLAWLLICQVLHHGGLAEIVDLPKLGAEYTWLDGVERAQVHAEVAAAHGALLNLQQLAQERFKTRKANPDARFDRIIVVIEDANATFDYLRRYWSLFRKTKDKAVSPALDAWEELVTIGRRVGVVCVPFAQQATAEGAGTAAARASMTNALIWGGEGIWKMLAPDILPIPRSSDIRGRVHLVGPAEIASGIAREVQLGKLTEEQCRDWATIAAQPPREPVPAKLRDAEASVRVYQQLDVDDVPF